MLAKDHLRYGALTMAAIFGGPGVFYVYESFINPRDALTAIIYLVIATALALSVEEKAAPKPGRRSALARCKAILLPRKPRH
jgi:hypothetical protein